jgi:hypothetical protein
MKENRNYLNTCFHRHSVRHLTAISIFPELWPEVRRLVLVADFYREKFLMRSSAVAKYRQPDRRFHYRRRLHLYPSHPNLINVEYQDESYLQQNRH